MRNRGFSAFSLPGFTLGIFLNAFTGYLPPDIQWPITSRGGAPGGRGIGLAPGEIAGKNRG